MALDRVIHQIAIAAKELQRIVADAKPGIRGEALGHGAGLGLIRRTAIQFTGSVVNHQPRRFQFGRHIREFKLQRLEIGEPLPELLPHQKVRACYIQAGCSRTEGTGGDIDAPTIEASHRDTESLAFRADTVGHWHAAILKINHRRRLTMPAQLVFLCTEAKAG